MAEISRNYKVSTEIITPVHVGSGFELQYNTDYVYLKNSGVISVISHQKILQLIGTQNIDTWISYINKRQAIDHYFTDVKKMNISPDDIASRTIKINGTPPFQQNIKEQLHNGTGSPYIPGSSIKGSLRTALLSILIAEEPDFVEKTENLKKQKGFGTKQKEFFDDGKLIKHYLGSDPNHNLMRLLRVGDAHFGETECNLINTVNKGHNEWSIKKSINQYAECIAPGQQTQFAVRIFDYGKLAGNRIHKNREILYDDSLIGHIKKFTENKINNELAFWADQTVGDEVVEYIESLNELEILSKGLKDNEALLRIGFGGGFPATTGDWAYDHLTDKDYDDLIYSLRHPKYERLLFPKTRKFTEIGYPIGFIKMRIEKHDV
jgi:CRISPR type III-A-associated RAMP protein Csm5